MPQPIALEEHQRALGRVDGLVLHVQFAVSIVAEHVDSGNASPLPVPTHHDTTGKTPNNSETGKQGGSTVRRAALWERRRAESQDQHGALPLPKRCHGDSGRWRSKVKLKPRPASNPRATYNERVAIHVRPDPVADRGVQVCPDAELVGARERCERQAGSALKHRQRFRPDQRAVQTRGHLGGSVGRVVALAIGAGQGAGDRHGW